MVVVSGLPGGAKYLVFSGKTAFFAICGEFFQRIPSEFLGFSWGHAKSRCEVLHKSPCFPDRNRIGVFSGGLADRVGKGSELFTGAMAYDRLSRECAGQ
jgi:hypothetical protein